jgi:cytochrome c oxidase subunit 3
MQQQQDTQRLGMWFFLCTEVLFFGGIFAAYTVYRIWYPREFEAGSAKLNVWIAGINSLLLLTSSLTITLAIHAAHKGDVPRLKRLLLVTAGLAIAFLGLKAREYYVDFEEGLIPGPHFNHAMFSKDGINTDRVQLFFCLYYAMTGLHVLHMIVGVGLILWQYRLARIGYYDHTERYVFIEVTSLYWHFVDMMWFFLVALLYVAAKHELHFHI